MFKNRQSEHLGYRGQAIKVKTAKRRKASSNRWLKRQLNDSYVAKSKLDGYRSRAAYKLLEINDKFHIFKPGQRVIDLGAAPGGWSQVASKLICASKYKNHIIAIDLLEIKPIADVAIMQGDFLESRAGLCDCMVDVVMSDMAANTIGHAATDHLRTMFLCEQAFEFACQVLKPGGHFISKIFRGGAEGELLKNIKSHFEVVKHFKPAASRKESSELYLVALGKFTPPSR